MKDWRTTKEYRNWRVAVIRRDKVCMICGSRQSRQAHHINSGAFFPDLRFDVTNGVCLCNECHTQFHCNFKNSFREKCTEKDWNNFVLLVQYIRGLL